MQPIIRHVSSDEKQTVALINEAAGILKKGGIAIFPTETVYGIGSDAFNEDACRRIYEAKKRPPEKPLIVLIADRNDLGKVAANVPKEAIPLMDAFWPGPLSIVFKKNASLPDVVTSGGDKVAVRLTSHPFLKELILAAGFPVVAPSANLSGNPPKTKAEDVIAEMGNLSDIIIEDDASLGGNPSTVIDVTGGNVRILREGAVSRNELEGCCLKGHSII